jgi:hypothetical protein
MHRLPRAPTPPGARAQAYWPFHRASCRPNQFADAIESAEPKFAAWMRGHGKLAVLKDDEVRVSALSGLNTLPPPTPPWCRTTRAIS